MRKQDLIFSDATEYCEKNSISHKTYRFPIEPIHKDYGRLICSFEFHRSKRKKKGRYYITELWVWFGQTDDKRYSGMVFKLPCYVEQFAFDNENGRSISFPRIEFCSIHKNPVMTINPENHHSKLIIEVGGSVLDIIKFS